MKQQVTNFSRFFASFNELPCYCGSREEFKKEIVSQYTFGRTESLKEMTWQEYNDCCDGLEKLSGRKDRLKRNRSICLKLIQEIGVDTTDWQRINEFCKHPRICGKEFARIRLDEMEDFQRKLRAIKKKGGLKEKEDVNNPGKMVMYIPLDGIPHASTIVPSCSIAACFAIIKFFVFLNVQLLRMKIKFQLYLFEQRLYAQNELLVDDL